MTGKTMFSQFVPIPLEVEMFVCSFCDELSIFQYFLVVRWFSQKKKELLILFLKDNKSRLDTVNLDYSQPIEKNDSMEIVQFYWLAFFASTNEREKYL